MINTVQTGKHLQEEFGFIANSLTPDEIIEYLNHGVRPLVEVVFTNNKVSMISLRLSPDRRLVKVRMHEEFLKAPYEVFDALRKYIATGRKACWLEVSHYASTIPAISRRQTPRRRLITKGRIYDLKEVLYEVKNECFSGEISCGITWGRARVSVRRRRRSVSLRFGSWDSVLRVIRINPVLDDTRVPREFLKYIVFHELLHAVVPARVRNNRRYDHTPEFRKMERRFPDYGAMKKMSRNLLDVLI